MIIRQVFRAPRCILCCDDDIMEILLKILSCRSDNNKISIRHLLRLRPRINYIKINIRTLLRLPPCSSNTNDVMERLSRLPPCSINTNDVMERLSRLPPCSINTNDVMEMLLRLPPCSSNTNDVMERLPRLPPCSSNTNDVMERLLRLPPLQTCSARSHCPLIWWRGASTFYRSTRWRSARLCAGGWGACLPPVQVLLVVSDLLKTHRNLTPKPLERLPPLLQGEGRFGGRGGCFWLLFVFCSYLWIISVF